MLIIEMPAGRHAERDYVLGTLLGEFLGLRWRRVVSDALQTRIALEGSDRRLILPDILLAIENDLWLTPRSMPARPLDSWDAGAALPEAVLVSPNLPVIYGDARIKFALSGTEIRLPIDIFGSAFFMLTRYEEVASPVEDLHGRFPGSESLAHREGFLRRPIVNEYVEVLWSAMKRLWPSLKRKVRQATSFVTCDVDEPYLASSRSFKTLLRQAGGDVLKRRNLVSASRRALGYAGARLGTYRWDPANTFDWMMDVNERAGNAMAFYFIADKTVPGLDGSAEIQDPFVLSLMGRIHERGHEIGLHGSYETYLDEGQLQRELGLLRSAMTRAAVEQADIGTRQHFLRWRTPITARALNNTGLTYDTTLGYADSPGFRCGTCYSFHLFDLATSETLTLQERPLIAMESSVISDQYQGLGYGQKAKQLLNDLKYRSLKFNGEFVLLWHNSHFLTAEDHKLYLGSLEPNRS
ncbi:MAG: polysaccharide deacetylase family protein [Hyphomicrobiaceae bacterium]|nr:polysaccharide deacetylase family protein [Hyphomicrobiaceae bacterium]